MTRENYENELRLFYGYRFMYKLKSVLQKYAIYDMS